MQQTWATAEGSYYVSSIDANNKHFEELYRLALTNVTYKALEVIKTAKTLSN